MNKKGNYKPKSNRNGGKVKPNDKVNGKFNLQGHQGDTIGTPYRDQSNMTKSNSSRRQREAAEAANTDAQLSRGNPVNYYTKYDKFVMDAANLPFATPLGAENFVNYSVADDSDAHVYSYTDEYYVPGVMAIHFVPTIGVSKDFTSPINRSSIRFYTYLRSNQKASGKYDHQDISMMEIAMDSCYMFHGLCSKIYGIINEFSPLNEYYSRALISALHVDYNSLRANLQDFRAYINAYAYSLGQYALPDNITLFDRHRWMVEGMYVDSTSTRAQTYMFVPEGFWQYDDTVETGSQCTFMRYNYSSETPLNTFADLKRIGDQLLNAVSNNADFAIISGDIYNFYGGNVYQLPYIDENYTILPVYEETVLSQIENLTYVGDLRTETLVISQNPNVNEGAIIFRPKTMQKRSTTYNRVPINFHHDSPTPEQVIEATRLIAVIQPATTTSGEKDAWGEVTACGTEIVTSLSIYTRDPSVSSGFSIYKDSYQTVEYYVGNSTVAALYNYARNFLALAQFDWAPRKELWIRDDDSADTYNIVGSTWDTDNYSAVPVDYISNIHLGCLLSLFKVGTNRTNDM